MIDLLEWRIAVQQHLGTALNGAASIVVDYPATSFCVSVGVLSGLAGWGLWRHVKAWRTEKTEKNEGDIAEMKRRILLDQKYADMIGDGLFEMMYRGEITRHEYRRDCKRFGIAYRLGDLLTRKNPKRGMEARIHQNIKTTRLVDASGQPIRPAIPGPKPGEDMPVPHVTQAKKWIAKGKALLRRAA